jgi:hypothetical protein
MIPIEGPISRTRGGSEWEPMKILLEWDENSNKTNKASKSCLRLNYPSWSRPRSHWSATDPRNQQPPSRTRERNETQLECNWPIAVKLVSTTGQTGP